MKSLVLALSLTVPLSSTVMDRAPERAVKTAVMCVKTGEEVSGLNRICYYECLGSTAAITINAADLCPMSINR